MFNFFANLFGYLLNYIYIYVNNYGVAIIIFSILLKLIMLPLSIKQQKTMAKSAEMQIKVKEIESKYANDKVRQSQELMDLYKRENMSPFSGCLGSIVQFIIVISMFYLVSSPLTYMKKADPAQITNYVKQIQEMRIENTEDGNSEGAEKKAESIRYREIAIIKEKDYLLKNVKENLASKAEEEGIAVEEMQEVKDLENLLDINMNFFGLDLSDIPSQNYGNIKVFIIPVLYVLTSILSMKLIKVKTNKPKEVINSIENNDNTTDEKALVPKENKEQDAMDEMQKQMNLMMPVMTVSIALIAPLGLALYWLVNNLTMIVERLMINKFFKGDKKD